MNPLFRDARYCWARGIAPSRNLFVSFERAFDWDGAAAATLHLFADTRYRLWVNDAFVAYGPGRFVTRHPEFDSHDLGRWLRAGRNVVRVEVNYYGCSSFQTMPDGLPGFIADGAAGDAVSFQTPGDWRARVHHAWAADAPHFSFAQNPAEICDLRVLAAELAAPADLEVEVLPAAAMPWPKPTPRTAPQPDYAVRVPARLLTAGPLVDAQRWGVQITRPGVGGAFREAKSGWYASFATWIHSPRAQEVRLDCFWSELALNGQPLTISYPGRLGNHGETTLALRAGWNFLGGNVELLADYWSLLLGLPREAGCSLHAAPDPACAEAFAISPPRHERVVPVAALPEEWQLPEGWTAVPSRLESVTPARLTAWETCAPETALRDLPYGRLAEVSTQTAAGALWSFDFRDEYYGQPVLEVEGPAGTIVDVAYDDWKRADGCVNLYHSNPFTDAADRFILRGGRQRIEVLNPRGGIYLQVVMRAPEGAGPAPLSLHEVAIRRRTLLNMPAGTFRCGDPLAEWTWRVSLRTLQASTDEAYADCPWRERGSYIGDCLVNLHLHRFVTPDLAVARRTFAIFGQAQRPDGQLQGCAPAWLVMPHEDYTLIWILAVRDLWAVTGDVDFPREQWAAVHRILTSPTWVTDANGLWDTTGMRMFIDWGVLRSERAGAGNAVVNILRVAALRAAAELAGLLGEESAGAAFAEEAVRVQAALEEHLWNESEGRFLASIGATTPAVHANILALRYGIGRADRILAYLEPRLRDNLRHGREEGQGTGYAELYFFYFLLPALAEHGRPDLAELIIAETYGFLRDLDLPTLPECFTRANEGRGSCCHSWSGAGAIYQADYVLGLRQLEPGNPDRWLLAPIVAGYREAEAELPHARGSIRVRWTRDGDGFVAHASVPAGVSIVPAANVTLVDDGAMARV